MSIASCLVAFYFKVRSVLLRAITFYIGVLKIEARPAYNRTLVNMV
ncbi:hypothetical protein JR338_09870 [Chloroflexota bacterium]|nr:hypothetical protein JR338_09870 [Chloroflexota bacterium]